MKEVSTLNDRFEYLDGLRGISILMVLLAHGGNSFGLGQWIDLGELGYKGVLVFFVISGFVITKLLLKEKISFGRINLKYFYIKRVLRIFPVFYLYVLTVFILNYSGIVHLVPEAFEVAIFHLWNYKILLFQNIDSTSDVWFLSHFWTLSLEEQFYIIWPLVLVSVHKSIKVEYALPYIILAFPIYRLVDYIIFPFIRGHTYYMLHIASDTILCGCYLGFLLTYRNDQLDLLFKKYAVLMNLAFVFCIYFLVTGSSMLLGIFKGYYLALFKSSLESFSISFLILYLIIVKPFWVSFLNYKPLIYIGMLSYSFYVWQQLFLSKIGCSLDFEFPLNYLYTFIAGVLSYYTIEKAGLYFKSKINNSGVSPILKSKI